MLVTPDTTPHVEKLGLSGSCRGEVRHSLVQGFPEKGQRLCRPAAGYRTGLQPTEREPVTSRVRGLEPRAHSRALRLEPQPDTGVLTMP